MVSVDNIHRLLGTLQQDLASKSEKSSPSDHSNVTRKNQSGKKKIDQDALKKSLSKKLASLPLNVDNNEKLARYVFLESVLLWEFGDGVSDSHQLNEIIQKIDSTIQADKELQNAFKSMLIALQAKP